MHVVRTVKQTTPVSPGRIAFGVESPVMVATTLKLVDALLYPNEIFEAPTPSGQGLAGDPRLAITVPPTIVKSLSFRIVKHCGKGLLHAVHALTHNVGNG